MKIQDRYEYDPKADLLGKGGFARVFRATDTLLHRDVALKVFSNSGTHQYSVLSEIRKVIGLEHPNLLRYFDVVLLEGTNNLGEVEKTEIGVMELANAGDLKDFARTNPGSPLLYKLLKDVLLGLEYLHSKGIIHRDLKAQNILLVRQDGQLTAKISDFGISKDTGAGGQSSSMMVGTIEYMAPEQFAPAKYGIDGKVASNLDLWSFGIMVHELLSGSTPFGSRDAETTAEQIMMQILSTELPEGIDRLPEPYKSVVRKCLVSNAKERIRKASELLRYFEVTGETTQDSREDDSTRVYPKGEPNAKANGQSASVDSDATKVYPKAGESIETSTAHNAHGENPSLDQITKVHYDRVLQPIKPKKFLNEDDLKQIDKQRSTTTEVLTSPQMSTQNDTSLLPRLPILTTGFASAENFIYSGIRQANDPIARPDFSGASKTIGIDLGNNNSCVAFIDGQSPTVILSEEGTRTTPSVVAYTNIGDVLVGSAAERQALTNLKNTI